MSGSIHVPLRLFLSVSAAASSLRAKQASTMLLCLPEALMLLFGSEMGNDAHDSHNQGCNDARAICIWRCSIK